jgi:hypothetical protein
VLAELLHVGPDEHLPQVGEIAVVLAVDLDDTPRVLASADLLSVVVKLLGRTDDGERNAVLKEERNIWSALVDLKLTLVIAIKLTMMPLDSLTVSESSPS